MGDCPSAPDHSRDVQGFGADEVCDLLEISPGNQRILLHRGRATLRAAPEEYYRV